jgi:hypothetical protein
MINFSTLNTIIAIVVVLLVLSLIVQSIQTFIKKLLKLKSQTIISSLEDLFENVIGAGTGTPETPFVKKSLKLKLLAILKAIVGYLKHLYESVFGTPDTGTPDTLTTSNLVQSVKDEFQKLGRKTIFGNAVLDSLAKDDLLKILTKVAAKNVIPNYRGEFQTLWNEITRLQAAIDAIDPNLLDGEANAEFASLEQSVSPLVNDMRSILEGNNVKTDIIFGDLMKLRQINIDQVLKLLGQVQQKVADDIASAQTSGSTQKVAELTILAAGLKAIAACVTSLSQAFDSAFAPLRTKLNDVETWYDTVMQGFDERYTRHMKSMAICIAFVVTVLLNANFFNIYRAIATNDVTRNVIVQKGPDVLAASKKSPGGAQGNPAVTATPKPTEAPTPKASPTTPRASAQTTASPTSSPTPSGSPSPTPSPTPDINEEVQQLTNEVNKLTGDYQGFGFAPLRLQQVLDFVSATGPWQGIPFSVRFAHGLKVLLGWLIMTLLLSAGAPFWQDTLESLFGVKNLLRQKAGTKKADDGQGEQTKS